MGSTAIQMLDKVLPIIENNSTEIITQYTRYMLLSSIFYVTLGIFLCIVSIKNIFISTIVTDEDAANFTRCVILILGMLCIFLNMGDLLAPKAAAIHQLLSDIT